MPTSKLIFTSESVTEGHPDKICDQVSDAIVDHLLVQDPCAMVRAECAVASNILFIATRFSADGNIDFSRLARKVIMQIGYQQPDFNPQTCSVLANPQALPLENRQCFDERTLSDAEIDRIPARNQVTVFGFACNQSPTLMPLPVWTANRLAQRLTELRKSKALPYLLPDGKVEVGIEYAGNRALRLHSLIFELDLEDPSGMDAKQLLGDIHDGAVTPVFQDMAIRPDDQTRISINPNGPYQGGPALHSGLTGRKNALDTYGEYTRHSGKALSGKDPLRIDRIGAYAARCAAKNVVAAGLAENCEVVLSYSPGLTLPVTLLVQAFGTGKYSDETLTALVERHFDFRPAGILKKYELRRLPAAHGGSFYRRLAAYGHFGRTDMELPWESTARAETLAADGR
jgi:S-adenosylmethionine synthetase